LFKAMNVILRKPKQKKTVGTASKPTTEEQQK
jgi:hypothetical protein